MNYKTLFFIFFSVWIGSTTTSLAQEPQYIEIYQGTEVMIQINNPFGQPAEYDPVEDINSLVLTEINGDNYIYKFTPDPSFLGIDFFSFEVITSPFPLIDTEIEEIFVEVIASKVKTADDFMHINSNSPVDINVLENDETSSENLTLTVAQVLRGTTEVNEDYSITYTPSEESDAPDYIIYTVSDEFNTISSATVYISNEYVLETELEVEEYSIASGKAQYIVLPNLDFTINTEEYSFGSIEQVNDFVYRYTSNSDADGVEEVNFTDSNGNVFQASISIIEKYYDEGYVKDDLFYSASNTSITFDVTENDVNEHVIADYSDELYHIGEGVFSYSPPPGFKGVKTFYYTADDGFTEETGTIELVINNYQPSNHFEYSLSTPQNQPRVIEYDVPLGTEYFEIASLPTYGSVELFTEDESVDLACEVGIQKVFVVYTPDADYVGADDVTIRYCASDNNICNDITIALDVVSSDVDECICVDDCVWPGDANGDGKVSVRDALSIGRFIGSGGSTQNVAPFGDLYEGVDVEDWLEFQANGKNVKHADANGDGVITIEDLDVVVDNYGDINSVISTDVLGIKSLPFTLSTTSTEFDSGDVVVLNVHIGSSSFPAIDLQGVAFAVNLPAALVDSSTVEVEYLEYGYLVRGAPYVSLTHQPSDGVIHTAGVKSNSIGSTGFGLVATVSFIVEADAEGFKDKSRTRSTSGSFEDAIATITASDIIIEDSRGYQYALSNTSLDITIKSGETESIETNDLSLYPNPTSNLVTVQNESGVPIHSINIYTLDGRLINKYNSINSSSAQIDVSTLENGMYVLEASDDQKTFTKKLIKE